MGERKTMVTSQIDVLLGGDYSSLRANGAVLAGLLQGAFIHALTQVARPGIATRRGTRSRGTSSDS